MTWRYWTKGKFDRGQDWVRNKNGGTDLRYRGAFPEWWVNIEIDYNADVLTAEQVTNLFNIAGFSQGIGEWRPEKDGPFGRYHVALGEEAAILNK